MPPPRPLVNEKAGAPAASVPAGKFAPLDDPPDFLDVVTENRGRPNAQLEAIILGGVVTAGDHHAAVHVPVQHRKIQQRRGHHADIDGVDPTGQQAFEQQMEEPIR